MERVGVLVHPTRPVLDAVDVVETWAAEHGLQMVQIVTGEQPVVAPAGEVTACDLIAAIGGDGTILKALHASAAARTPVLGVAYGSLGALTKVPVDELTGALDRFAAGDWQPLELPALRISAAGAYVGRAINDLVVARGRGTQLMVDVSVDGDLYVRIAGDGVAVATPLGSSAYSMAAGGSLLAAGTEAFVCTPLAMHGGCAPPLVVSASQEVTLDLHPGHSGCYVDVDGFPVDIEGEQLSVTSDNGYATLVTLDGSNTGLPNLRARGLISDSPRLLGQERREAWLRARDESAARERV